jgi:hypothetical protein
MSEHSESDSMPSARLSFSQIGSEIETTSSSIRSNTRDNRNDVMTTMCEEPESDSDSAPQRGLKCLREELAKMESTTGSTGDANDNRNVITTISEQTESISAPNRGLSFLRGEEVEIEIMTSSATDAKGNQNIPENEELLRNTGDRPNTAAPPNVRHVSFGRNMIDDEFSENRGQDAVAIQHHIISNQVALEYSVREGTFRQPSSVTLLSRLLPELSNTHQDSETKLGKLLDFSGPYIVLLIFVNSVMIGIGTFDFVTDNENIEYYFELTDKIFLIIFTVEVVLNLTHFCRLDRLYFSSSQKDDDSASGDDNNLWYSSWLPKLPPLLEPERRKRKKEKSWIIFDLIIIVISWAVDGNGTSIFRSFRILRAVRLLSKVRSLKNLTRALLHVCPKMGALAFITCILFLVLGIMCTLLFGDLVVAKFPDDFVGDNELSYDYFGDISLSMLTLFQLMTFDNWHEPVREVMQTKSWAWTIFVFWVFVSGFVIMNLIIAIVCESLVKLDQFGVKALHGEEIVMDEFSIQDASVSSTDGQIAQRLMQLENALHQLLEDEVKILEELEKMKNSSKMPVKSSIS